MNLEIYITSEAVQSAEMEDGFTRASKIIARMILNIKTIEEPPSDNCKIFKHKKVKNDQS